MSLTGALAAEYREKLHQLEKSGAAYAAEYREKLHQLEKLMNQMPPGMFSNAPPIFEVPLEQYEENTLNPKIEARHKEYIEKHSPYYKSHPKLLKEFSIKYPIQLYKAYLAVEAKVN